MLKILSILLLLCGSWAQAADLAWNASVVDEQHAAPDGYRIHRGATPGVYNWQADAGNVLQWPIPDDLYGSYYWAVSAYNAIGSSGYSNEVFWQRGQPQYPGATALRASKLQQQAGAGMAELTGTPVEIDWASGANPAGQSITIPADATAVLMFWAYNSMSQTGGLASATLNSVSPSATYEYVNGDAWNNCGVAIWFNPATGERTLDPAWDEAPDGGGAVCIVAFVKNVNTTAWRDADGLNTQYTTAISLSLTTNSTDLVLKFDTRFDDSEAAPPGTTTGWTSRQTAINSLFSARLSSADAPGASSTTCTSENEFYSSLVCVSLQNSAAAVPKIMLLQDHFSGGIY